MTTVSQVLSSVVRGERNVKVLIGLAVTLLLLWVWTRPKHRRSVKDSKGKPARKGKKESAVGMVWRMLCPDFTRLELTGGGWQLYGIFLLSLVRIWIMNATSRVVQRLDVNAMTRDQAEFWAGWREQLKLAFIACFHRQTYKYVENSLAVEWRKKLTKDLHGRYFKGMNYYLVAQNAAQGGADDAAILADADERITEDAKEVSTQLAHVFCEGIYASTAGTFFATKLGQFYGIHFALAPYIYLWSMFFMKGIIAPFKVGKWIAETRGLFTSYKSGHQMLVKNSEAVAALEGAKFEEETLVSRFKKAIQKARAFHKASVWPNFVEQMCFMWLLRSFMSSFVIGPHLFLTKGRADLTSIESIAKLRGDIGHQFVLFVQSMIAAGTTAKMLAQIPRVSGAAQRVKSLVELLNTLPSEDELKAQNKVLIADRIEFADVDIATPSGNLLVEKLSFRLDKGHSLLLTGHNGAGKSSIFRCLGGLWEAKSGTITKPGCLLSEGLHETGGVYYLPQKPYNVTGTLIEQIAYPVKQGGCGSALRDILTDEQMREILGEVDLVYLMDQHGVDKEVAWGEVLSLGEMQRMAMARLLFHKPDFAILDECTSAVSGEMERRLYETILRTRGTSFITISHRPVLKMYHDQLLTIGLPGAKYSLETIDATQHQQESSRHAATKKVTTTTEEETKKTEKKSVSTQHASWSAFMKLVAKGLPKQKLVRLACIVAVVLAQVGIKVKTTEIMGGLMSTVFKQDRSEFVRLVKKSLVCAVLAGVCEQGLAYMQNDTAETMMENLTQNLLTRYLRHNNFYKVSQIEKSVTDPHQRITTDLRSLTTASAAVIPQFIKPLIELIWFSHRIGTLTGKKAVFGFFGYLASGFVIIRLAMPGFRKIASEESRMEGVFKSQHSFVKDHCESIAFYGGGRRENEMVDAKLGKLMTHANLKLYETWKFNLVNGAIVREAPFVVQWVLRNEFGKHVKDAEVLKDGGTSLGGAQTFIFDATTQMFDCMGQLLNFSEHLETLYGLVGRVTELDIELDAVEAKMHTTAIKQSSGTFVSMVNTNVVTPADKTLLKNLTLKVTCGEPLMVTGRNGVGKTSFFRVLGGLWPATTGEVSVPAVQENGRRAIYLVPQKVFMPSGTFADQVTYPERVDTSTEDVRVHLASLLALVGVDYLAERHGWGAEKNWELILSLGEQQRVGMARLFYHKVCVATKKKR